MLADGGGATTNRSTHAHLPTAPNTSPTTRPFTRRAGPGESASTGTEDRLGEGRAKPDRSRQPSVIRGAPLSRPTGNHTIPLHLYRRNYFLGPHRSHPPPSPRCPTPPEDKPSLIRSPTGSPPTKTHLLLNPMRKEPLALPHTAQPIPLYSGHRNLPSLIPPCSGQRPEETPAQRPEQPNQGH